MTYSGGFSQGAVPANSFDSKTRQPWNNVIFPGNYCQHLNAYYRQGVAPFPGMAFFSIIGAVVVLPIESTSANILNSSGQVPVGTYSPLVLSPDLGPAPKPLPNLPFKIPAGAYVYSTAVTSQNLDAASTSNLSTLTVSVGATTGAVLTADANGSFNVCGARDIDYDWANITALGAEANVSVALGVGALKPVNVSSGGSGSAFADPDSGQSAIIVEVDFWLPEFGPDSDATHLPYPYSSESY